MTTVEQSDEEKQRKQALDLFNSFKIETEKRQISSSENFDKSVLTYASWAFGISIAFLKDFIPINVAKAPYLLYVSWIFFVSSIVLTTTSFLLSYKVSSSRCLELRSITWNGWMNGGIGEMLPLRS